MDWNRREFLKAGGWTALALGLNAYSPAIFKRRILAQPVVGDKKLIFIFQRGGNDGLNTVIPRGDSQYSTRNRPTLYIPEGPAIDLGNGFAQLHPAMNPIMEIYNSMALNGVDGPGNLAIIHRVGYEGQSQSHFDSQQWWETGYPRPAAPTEEGMLYREVTKAIDPTGANALAGVSVSGKQITALKGKRPLPTVSNLDDFKFKGSSARVQKLLGNLPSAPLGPDGKGLLGLYGGPRDFPAKPYRDLVYGTGMSLVNAMNIIQDAVAMGPYTPSNGANYPGGKFGSKLRQIAMLLKRTPVRILGVNIGGFDTHSNQGGLSGKHSNLLSNTARAFQAFYRDLQDQWQDLIIVTMTEFGRTSKENGSTGTDHAYACVVFAAGGAVKGGVYNCDPTTWRSGDMFSAKNRYVRHRVDFRGVFAEIFTKHFGDDPATVNQVIGNYSSLSRRADFQPLGFIV